MDRLIYAVSNKIKGKSRDSHETRILTPQEFRKMFLHDLCKNDLANWLLLPFTTERIYELMPEEIRELFFTPWDILKEKYCRDSEYSPENKVKSLFKSLLDKIYKNLKRNCSSSLTNNYGTA
jgi:hypothetical protein